MNKLINIHRVITFVPEESAEDFAAKIGPHIPHIMGDYDHVCWFSESGTEQARYIPSGDLKQVSSVRFEFCVRRNEDELKAFIQAIQQYHPWTEPVILVEDARIKTHSE